MYLSDNCPGEEILYDIYKKGFYISGLVDNSLSGVELLSIIKITIESRAFCDYEVETVIKAKKGKIVAESNGRVNPKYTLFWSNREDVKKIIVQIYIKSTFSLARKRNKVEDFIV